MIVTLKALSALLTYPSADLQAMAPEIGPALAAEGLLPPDRRAALEPLLGELATRDLMDLQERFVFLFDRTRSLSLNLFEHIHGDSRDRGPAMVDLLETYRAGGWDLTSSELPDHLPILLEFLSLRPLAEARETLADAGHVIAVLGDRLEKRTSSYAAVMRAVTALTATPASAELIEELSAQPDDDPEDLASLDAVWEETQVTFGPDPDAGCPASRDILARMAAPTSAAAS